MSQPDIEALFEEIKKKLEADPDAQRDAMMDSDGLAKAMAHPKAAEQIQANMEIESQAVNQGEQAPDFTLKELSSRGEMTGRQITLSDHFGQRPVALIFGSYT